MNDSALSIEIADFGRDRSSADMLQDKMIRRALARRLNEKIRNYEKAAVKLEMRGEDDAAGALHRAANRLRAVTRNVPRETVDGG